MPPVTIYTTAWCGFCNAAKHLLTRNKITYTEIDIEQWDEPWERLRDTTGGVSVPQIVIGESPIGGYDDLSNLDRTGALEELMAR